MSDIVYRANPSVWRLHPLGTLLSFIFLAAGAWFSLTGRMPYAEIMAARAPALSGLDLNPRHVGYGLLALGAFNLLRWWLATLADRLEISTTEILWTHGLLSRDYTEISIASVRTVRVYQSLFQRLLGAGDLVIFTSGDDPELSIKGLPRPNDIRDHIRRQANRET